MMSPTSAWHLILGPTLWAIWFVIVYGGLSVACAVAPPDPDQGPLNGINLLLWVPTLALVVLLALGARRCWRGRPGATDLPASAWQRFMPSLAAGLYLLSALATLFIGLPILALDPCS